jgi:hypothetical protein
MRRALTAGTVMRLEYHDETSLRAAKLAWREMLNRDAKLTVSAHRVATYFCEVATVDGIFPSQARMALELDVCERSIRGGIAALKKRGWIVAERMGSGRSNVYALAYNRVLAKAIELRRQEAKETIAQARFERRTRSSDRQRFAGVTGSDLPVQTGRDLPLMTGRDLPPIPLREIPCSDPLQENPSIRGNREDKHDPIAAHCTVKDSQSEHEPSQKLREIAAALGMGDMQEGFETIGLMSEAEKNRCVEISERPGALTERDRFEIFVIGEMLQPLEASHVAA